jgi:hypothetical protein
MEHFIQELRRTAAPVDSPSMQHLTAMDFLPETTTKIPTPSQEHLHISTQAATVFCLGILPKISVKTKPATAAVQHTPQQSTTGTIPAKNAFYQQ